MKTTAPVRQSAMPSEAELLERARRLVPVLKARAQATEDNRSMLPETLDDFVSAEFYRALQPARFGGFEMSPMAIFRVAMELAKACPSSAWCLCLIAVHNWEVALLDPQAAEDIWGRDPSVRISSSYAPFGKVERVEGGFRIKGRWPWSSGSDHCTWAMLGGLVHNLAGGPPEVRSFLVPRSEYEIDDTWHVMGLKGTGSKDIVVADAFVPEHRTHSFAASFAMADPGAETFTSRNYKYPFGTVFAYCLASVTVGMADGAREAFIADMKERLGAYDGAKAIEDPFVRQRLAEADALIRSIHGQFEANFAVMDRLIDAGKPITPELRVDLKWDAQHIAKGALQAVELLFKATGGRGVRAEHPIQRFFRDVHTASNHAFLNAEKGSVNAGYVALGGTTSDFAL
jgi:3-hydroxy-9,10-secoandrosta-1,3,5(10)-triene-9,17-dione monooxygenase